jgi:isopenicillin N synthase-like dioxygenase
MAFTSFAGNSYAIVSDEVREASGFDEIPMIDLSLPRDELVARLRDACTRVGFFYIKNHGIPQDTIDRVFAAAQAFFHLDEEVKRRCHFTNTKALCGYEGLQNVYTDETRKPDLNEAFSWRYSPDLDRTRAAGSSHSSASDIPSPSTGANNDDDEQALFLTGQNQWPEALPEMRSGVTEYYGQVLALARHLIRYFALALGLPEGYFDDMMERPGSMGKVLHYPPQLRRAADAPLGIGAHTDIECFTILCQGGDVPALQVLNPRGEWVLAPPIPGTFVVNIGDMLARWSNDTFRSTIHRVLNITGQERYSMPVFNGPSYETVIEPLATCLAQGAKYDPIPAGLYVFKRLAVSRLDRAEYEMQLSVMEGRYTGVLA